MVCGVCLCVFEWGGGWLEMVRGAMYEKVEAGWGGGVGGGGGGEKQAGGKRVRGLWVRVGMERGKGQRGGLGGCERSRGGGAE